MKNQGQWLPWTRSCFVCGEANAHGLRLRSRLDENGRVVLEHEPRESDLGYRNIVHGGIAATLLDEVMTWVAIVTMRTPCVAAEMSFRLKHPITLGSRLTVIGKLTRNLRRLLITEGEILDPDGKVLVSSTGKYVPMPDRSVEFCEEDFVKSPDVISPSILFGQKQTATKH